MTDLISRDALVAELIQLRDNLLDDPDPAAFAHAMIEAAKAAPRIRPQVVANITGGVLQGASSDYPVEIHTLDFETDSFDEKTTGIVVDGSTAYLGGQSANIDPDFVRSVVEADTVFIHNEVPVCGECDGTGKTQSKSNLEEEVCPVCDGSGERPDLDA